MANVEELVQAKLKVRAFKNEVDPDGRAELCGEPVQRDEDGREFFEIPAHQMEYLKQLLPSYDFSDPFERVQKPRRHVTRAADRGNNPC